MGLCSAGLRVSTPILAFGKHWALQKRFTRRPASKKQTGFRLSSYCFRETNWLNSRVAVRGGAVWQLVGLITRRS